MSEDFIILLEAFEKEKGISRDVLIEAIELALESAYKRNYGSAQNVRVVINRENGSMNVYIKKEVVEEVFDDEIEISIEDAKNINPVYEMGDFIEQETQRQTFGRIAAQTARQVLMQRIREAERGIIFTEFSGKENNIITGIVERVEKKSIMINIGMTEAMLMPGEQVPSDKYRQGQRLKIYVVEVQKTTKGPQIMISRTHSGLVKRLFELEVPEIQNGVVEIKSVSREAGSRSKVAVWSNDPNVDAIGACVGTRGTRVQSVVDELNGEKIDIIKYSNNPEEFIAAALAPAKVISCEANEEERICNVVVAANQLSLAIGKEGQNVRLAAKLTGWKIDITKSKEDDLEDHETQQDQN